jgi:uncharacterized membrane protein YgcG
MASTRSRGGTARLIKALLTALMLTLIVGLFAFGISAMFGAGSDSEMRYTNLDYHAQVKANGDVRVTQKVTIHMDERDDDQPWRQLFQTYKRDGSQYFDITDVSVRNDTTDEDYTKTAPELPSDADDDGVDWDSEMAGTWYKSYSSEEVSRSHPGTIEIGWNIPATYSETSMTFTIGMTFTEAVSVHPDVAEFQWEPIGVSNTIPVDHVSGTVSWPRGITAKNSWAWLHYESASTTARGSNGELKFTAENVQPGNYLDVRAMFDATAMNDDVPESKISETPAKNTIMAEEDGKESGWRADQRKAAIIRLTLWIVSAVVIVGLSIWAIVGAIVMRRQSQYSGALDYWREPPAMSPAAAAHMLNVMEPVSSKELKSRELTSTLLSLASKKAILLLPGVAPQERGATPDAVVASDDPSTADIYALGSSTSPLVHDEHALTVVILSEKAAAHTHLSTSEKRTLDALKSMDEAAEDRGYFDLTAINKLLKQPSSQSQAIAVSHQLDDLYSEGENEFNQLQATSGRFALRGLPVLLLLVSGLAAGIYFSLTGQVLIGLVLGFVGLFVGFFCNRWNTGTVLTQAGQEWAGKVVGLRNYLLDFSSFKDRGVQDLALWDRYLVYAASFGISKEVSYQLLVNDPHLAEPGMWGATEATQYSLLYCYYRPYFGYNPHAADDFSAMSTGPGFDLGDISGSLSSNLADIQSTVSAATSASYDSSGGSSGGSFSGGGGFGGGGGGFGGGSFGGR